VLHSLFEEQLSLESEDLSRNLSRGTDAFPEALTYFPDMPDYNLGPDGYLEHIRQAKAAVKIPVIASLNGTSLGGWVRFARDIEQAGADALELNIYFIPTDRALTGVQIEHRYYELVGRLRSQISIPLAVKLSPYFSAPANVAHQLSQLGANGLVLFNRFYQPDFDLRISKWSPLSLSARRKNYCFACTGWQSSLVPCTPI
jgi:dihydroorotate dehydrogenase (fumarate)